MALHRRTEVDPLRESRRRLWEGIGLAILVAISLYLAYHALTMPGT